MLRIKILFILFACLMALSSSFASDLTERNVMQLIAQVDNAVNRLDARGVAAAMSDDVEIVMHITSQGRKQVVRPGKYEYLQMLEQGWSMYSNYTYRRSNMVIEIQGGKAVVTADIHESMTFQGQRVSGSSKEEAVVEIINGKPMITRAIAYVSM